MYDPVGRISPTGNARLVLYDATPVHHGFRWGVVVFFGQGRLPKPFVLKLSEADFNTYQPVPAPPASQPSSRPSN